MAETLGSNPEIIPLYSPHQLELLASAEGIVELSQKSAFDIFQDLKEIPRPQPKETDYHTPTGLHKDAVYPELSQVLEDGSTVKIKLCNHGSQIVSFTIEKDGHTTSIIHPPEPAGNPFNRGDVLRGGGLIADPHNCENEAGDNYHGTLSMTNAEVLAYDPQSGLIIFGATPNLIPEPVPHQEQDTLKIIAYQLKPDGRLVNTVQTFNFGESVTRTNQALHPYFDTRDNLPTAIQAGDAHYSFQDEINQRGPFSAYWGLAHAEFRPMNKYGNAANLPTLSLLTPNYQVNFTPLKGFDPEQAEVGAWTNRIRQYTCLELLPFRDEPFSPQEEAGVDHYIAIAPDHSHTIAAEYQALAA